MAKPRASSQHLCLHDDGYDFKRLFPFCEYYDQDRTAFYRALRGRGPDLDLTGALALFTAGLATHFDGVKLPRQLAVCRDLLVCQHPSCDRKAAAVGHVITHGHLTTQDYEGLRPGRNRRTLQRGLKSLLE